MGKSNPWKHVEPENETGRVFREIQEAVNENGIAKCLKEVQSFNDFLKNFGTEEIRSYEWAMYQLHMWIGGFDLNRSREKNDIDIVVVLLEIFSSIYINELPTNERLEWFIHDLLGVLDWILVYEFSQLSFKCATMVLEMLTMFASEEKGLGRVYAVRALVRWRSCAQVLKESAESIFSPWIERVISATSDSKFIRSRELFVEFAKNVIGTSIDIPVSSVNSFEFCSEEKFAPFHGEFHQDTVNMIDRSFSTEEDTPLGIVFQHLVERLHRGTKCLWFTLPARTFPENLTVYTKHERENRIRRVRRLEVQTKKPRRSRDEILSSNREIAAMALGMNVEFFEKMMKLGFSEATADFVKMVEAYDRNLAKNRSSVFQAGRNVWTCLALDLIINYNGAIDFANSPIAMNRAYLGYSLLYPYIDDYLDDPKISKQEKMEFQKKFRCCLAYGEKVFPPSSEYEKKTFGCITEVESVWPREEYPCVYLSMIAIHDAQSLSLSQHSETIPPWELIFDATFKKGGTSVLADAFMVQGQPTWSHLVFTWILGVALQLVDDIQDAKEDSNENQHTLFTVPYVFHEQCNDLMGRLLNLCANSMTPLSSEMKSLEKKIGSIVLDDVSTSRSNEGGTEMPSVEKSMMTMTYSILVKAIARSSSTMFSSDFLKKVEERAPLPLSSMRRLSSMRKLLDLIADDAI